MMKQKRGWYMLITGEPRLEYIYGKKKAIERFKELNVPCSELSNWHGERVCIKVQG